MKMRGKAVDFLNMDSPKKISGSVRVVSKRKGGAGAAADETIIDVDRTHPILGNPHVLHNHRDSQERSRVIALLQADLQADERVRGPMNQALAQIALRVQAGERIALRCWCAPRPCHADLYRERIEQLAGLRPEQGSMFD